MNHCKMDDQISIQEAGIASLQSMETLILSLNGHHHHRQDCTSIAEQTVSKFKNFISALDRTGHARFRRGPVHPPPQVQPSLPPLTLTLDFKKPDPKPAAGVKVSDDLFSLSPPISDNSSLLSSITADCSESNGSGSSLFFSAAPTVGDRTVSNGRPPLSSSSSKRKSGGGAAGDRCHCSKKRKERQRRSIRVPAISSKIAEIPSDGHSWRKYGQKPIKGSPHTSPYDSRAYYKCSGVRGCPARKRVERAFDDASILVVTYEADHRHDNNKLIPAVGGGSSADDFIVLQS